MKKILLAVLFAFAFPLFFSGCVFFKEDAKVSSFAAPEKFPPRLRYAFESGDPARAKEDLEFIEYAKIVDEMLAAKGYENVPVADANCVVKMRFGIANPETVYSSERTPIYGTVGYNSDSRGNVRRECGIIGYDERTISNRMFTRFLMLECWTRASAESDVPAAQLWKTQATNYGLSSDMQAGFPLLALATFPWIGKSSNGQKTISEFPSEALETLREKISAESGARK